MAAEQGLGRLRVRFLRPHRTAAIAGGNRGAVGEFFWDGFPSMLFWVDPQNDMAVVFATQKVPFDGTLHHDIRDAIYGPYYSGE